MVATSKTLHRSIDDGFSPIALGRFSIDRSCTRDLILLASVSSNPRCRKVEVAGYAIDEDCDTVVKPADPLPETLDWPRCPRSSPMTSSAIPPTRTSAAFSPRPLAPTRSPRCASPPARPPRRRAVPRVRGRWRSWRRRGSSRPDCSNRASARMSPDLDSRTLPPPAARSSGRRRRSAATVRARAARGRSTSAAARSRAVERGTTSRRAHSSWPPAPGWNSKLTLKSVFSRRTSLLKTPPPKPRVPKPAWTDAARSSRKPPPEKSQS